MYWVSRGSSGSEQIPPTAEGALKALETGVAAYVDKIGAELRDTMMMRVASSVEEITDEMIWKEQTV